MARVNEQVLDCVVYLYQSTQDAERGDRIGGSGFLLSVAHYTPEPLLERPLKPREFARQQQSPSWELNFHLYVVTAKHVVAPPSGDGCSVVRVNTTAGGTDTLEIPLDQWHVHPEGADVAIAPIQLGQQHRATWVPLSWVMTEFLDDLLEVGPGDDVVIAGRFINIEGKQQNQPALRFGRVSMRPGDLIRTSPNDPGQRSFLVECHSIPGFSGSPVFLDVRQWELQQPSLRQVISHLQGQSLWLLLGVDWGHVRDEEKVRQPDGEWVADKLHIRSNTGMMAVVPAWNLVEILNLPELVELRKRESEQAEQQRRFLMDRLSETVGGGDGGDEGGSN